MVLSLLVFLGVRYLHGGQQGPLFLEDQGGRAHPQDQLSLVGQLGLQIQGNRSGLMLPEFLCPPSSQPHQQAQEAPEIQPGPVVLEIQRLLFDQALLVGP